MEEIINKIVFVSFMVVASLMLAYHGLTCLFGKYVVLLGFKIVIGGVCIGVGGWLVVLAWSVPMGVISAYRVKREAALAQIRQMDAYSGAAAIKHATGEHVVLMDTRTGVAQQFIKHRIEAQPPIEETQIEANPFENLDAVEIFEQIYRRTLSKQNCPSFIIAGEKRSGKSTFAEYLTHRYANEAEFIVFDPKQADPLINWGPTVRLVGQNSNYAEMSAEMDMAEAEVATMSVDPKRPKRFYMFDEWINLLAVREDKFGKRVFGFMLRVLTEWSYLGIGAIIMPHATEKTALGFPPGYGGLVRNFDGAIWFDYNLFSDERRCFFETKGNQYEIRLWNPATAPRGGAPAHWRTDAKNDRFGGDFDECAGCAGAPFTIDYDPNTPSVEPEKRGKTDFYESKVDKTVVEMYRAGKSERQICGALGWSSGGRSSDRIEKILKKYIVGAGV